MTVIFEVFIALVFIAMLIWAAFCVEDERGSVSFFGTATLLALILGASQYFYGFATALYVAILANPAIVVALVAGYFVVGALYVLGWRYKSYLEDNTDNIRAFFVTWKTKNERELNSLPEDEIKRRFIESDDYAYKYGPGRKKGLITTWILWWPLSLTCHISYRPVKYICEKIYDYISKWLVSIFKRSSKNIIG